MKNTFFIDDEKKYKIDVNFKNTGKEKIFVNDVLVHEGRSLSMNGSRDFNAGPHDVRIDMKGGLKEWSCKVFVDGSLFIEELFPDELNKLKKTRSNLRKYYLFLTIFVIVVLLFSFLKGIFQGYSG